MEERTDYQILAVKGDVEKREFLVYLSRPELEEQVKALQEKGYAVTVYERQFQITPMTDAESTTMFKTAVDNLAQAALKEDTGAMLSARYYYEMAKSQFQILLDNNACGWNVMGLYHLAKGKFDDVVHFLEQ